MISDSLHHELRGINEISFLFKRGAKQFSQVFCDRQTQVDSASAKPSPPNYVRIFDSAVTLVEPTSSLLTYDRLASHVSAVSPDSPERPLTAPLLKHQHIHGDDIAKGRTNEENNSDDCCFGMCVIS